MFSRKCMVCLEWPWNICLGLKVTSKRQSILVKVYDNYSGLPLFSDKKTKSQFSFTNKISFAKIFLFINPLWLTNADIQIPNRWIRFWPQQLKKTKNVFTEINWHTTNQFSYFIHEKHWMYLTLNFFLYFMFSLEVDLCI